jgi:hypothetical protein
MDVGRLGAAGAQLGVSKVENVHGRVQRKVFVGVWMTRSLKVWRIDASSPRACSHWVGAAHALVWRSPTS